MSDEAQTTMAGDAAGQPLFDMFPPATYEEWRAAAEKTLKGAPFEKRLITRTYEHISLQPIYNAEDIASLPHINSLPGFEPFVRSTRVLGYVIERWDVCQELPYPTPREVNQAARDDLPRGLTALNLSLDQATLQGVDPDAAPVNMVGAGGMSLASVDDAAMLFDGVALDRTPLFVVAGASALPVAALILAAAERCGIAHDQIQGCIGADPLGALAAQGALPLSLERSYDLMARWTAWARTHAPRLRTIMVATHIYHNGGATAVQDLAFALATGVAYLRAMQKRGLDVDVVAPQMQFAFSIGSQFFLEIARLRAARMLWARVISAFGGGKEAQKMRIHGRTSAWTKSRFDAYNNMLRATGEAMAGVMGGVDSLHVSHFDEALGLPDEFSRRIARNVQVILQEECNFIRLIDPPGGSWAVETLTDQVAQKAWELFQEIERRGGMASALIAGFPQSAIAATRTERFSAIAQRREVIIGVNMYPNLKEKLLTVRPVDYAAVQAERSADVQRVRRTRDAQVWQDALDALAAALPDRLVELALAAARASATLGDLAAALASGEAAGPTIEPIPAHRAAEQFETLRLTADAYAAHTGARPRVFLANMGPIPQHKARADFSTGFFEAGGFEVIGNDGFATVEEAAQAALASGAGVVTICSTDETYPEIVPPLTNLIKSNRPDVTVVLAGYPADQVEAHRAAGVDEFIHIRANCYETLVRLQQLKGVVA
jgi:methylmalonyl-CoA mutase